MRIGIHDGLFPGSPSMTTADERAGEGYPGLEWVRGEKADDLPIQAHTDTHFFDLEAQAKKRIGILVEPCALHPEFYRRVADNLSAVRHYYDLVFTHYRPFLALGAPFVYYPFGGSRIREWGMFQKEKNISLIVGAKNQTAGHQLRHRVAEHDEIIATQDLYGQPFTDWMPSKVPALRPYRFSIVIESAREEGHFTEKLIDCFSQATIPIYWGAPDIGSFFDERGMLPASNMSEIVREVRAVGHQPDSLYRAMLPYLRINLELARQYVFAERWIAREMVKHGIA